MSRIGKQPITVPSAVKVDIAGAKVSVSGPKGNLSREVNAWLDWNAIARRVIAHYRLVLTSSR